MKTVTYGYVSELKQEFREEGRAEGREEGRAEGVVQVLLAVLDSRALGPTEADRDRIRSCTDQQRLLRWTARAATASNMAEVFGD